MYCPKCWSEKKVKNGFKNDKQRYKCKECWCNYSKSYLWRVEFNKKVEALKLYLEWLWFRAIWRILWVSNVSVLNWIRMFWEIAMLLFSQMVSKLEKEKIEKLELDEMWHYIKKNKINSGFGLLAKDEQLKLLNGLFELVEKKQEKNLVKS